jgi:hypothetical protein
VNREKGWAQQHASDIKGSSSAFLYFDHARRPAHVAFGAGERQRAADWLRPARKDARVRAFTSQSIGEFGGEYKWRACSSEKLEVWPVFCTSCGQPSERLPQLLKGSAVIATWERKLDVDGNDAQLTLKHAALPIITDVLATLTLNRMRLELGWE